MSDNDNVGDVGDVGDRRGSGRSSEYKPRTLNELMARIVERQERREKLVIAGVPNEAILIEDQITEAMRRQYLNRSAWLFKCVCGCGCEGV